MSSKEYIPPRKVLTDEEYEEYQKTKQSLRRRGVLDSLRKLKQRNTYESNVEKYNTSTKGKISRGIVGAISSFKRGNLTRRYYQSTGQSPIGNVNKTSTVRGVSGRGRPRGTYDKRYAEFGGVYGWRKWQSLQLKQQRMEMLRRATINPRQQVILDRIEARDQATRMSPESRTIPDTTGRVPIRNIMEEIDFSANLVA